MKDFYPEYRTISFPIKVSESEFYILQECKSYLKIIYDRFIRSLIDQSVSDDLEFYFNHRGYPDSRYYDNVIKPDKDAHPDKYKYLRSSLVHYILKQALSSLIAYNRFNNIQLMINRYVKKNRGSTREDIVMYLYYKITNSNLLWNIRSQHVPLIYTGDYRYTMLHTVRKRRSITIPNIGKKELSTKTKLPKFSCTEMLSRGWLTLDAKRRSITVTLQTVTNIDCFGDPVLVPAGSSKEAYLKWR